MRILEKEGETIMATAGPRILFMAVLKGRMELQYSARRSVQDDFHSELIYKTQTSIRNSLLERSCQDNHHHRPYADATYLQLLPMLSKN